MWLPPQPNLRRLSKLIFAEFLTECKCNTAKYEADLNASTSHPSISQHTIPSPPQLEALITSKRLQTAHTMVVGAQSCAKHRSFRASVSTFSARIKLRKSKRRKTKARKMMIRRKKKTSRIGRQPILEFPRVALHRHSCTTAARIPLVLLSSQHDRRSSMALQLLQPLPKIP